MCMNRRHETLVTRKAGGEPYPSGIMKAHLDRLAEDGFKLLNHTVSQLIAAGSFITNDMREDTSNRKKPLADGHKLVFALFC